METVTHHGRQTAYKVWNRGGTGPPVLCIHGSGATHAIWKSQTRLADDFPLVALDLSGHGESEDVDADPGFETFAAYADDVLAVAEETNAGVLLGNSMGGAVVLHCLLERDVDPQGVVLAGTGAKLGVLKDLRDWLSNDFDRAVDFLHGPDRLFHDPDEQLSSLSREVMRETGQRVTRRDFLTCHRFDVRDRLEAVDVPTCCVAGEHDQLTPVRFHEYLAEHIPDARLSVIEDAAHLTMLEEPTAFNDLLSSFVSDVQT